MATAYAPIEQSVAAKEQHCLQIVEQLKDAGNTAFKNQDYPAAIDSYKRARHTLEEQKLDNPALQSMLLNNLATVEYKLEIYEECIKHANHAVDLDSSNDKARYRIILAALMIRDGSTAINQLQLLTASSSSPSKPISSALEHLQPVATALSTHQSHLKQKPSTNKAVIEVLDTLTADLDDDEADVDVEAALVELKNLLSDNSDDALATFESHNGYPLLLYYIHTAAYCQVAGRVLQVINPALWPFDTVWKRLIQMIVVATDNNVEEEVALGLIVDAAQQQPWIRQHLLLTSRQLGCSEPALKLVLDKSTASPVHAVYSIALLESYAEDQQSINALIDHGYQPLQLLLRLCANAEQLVGTDATNINSKSKSCLLPASEVEALKQLRIKQKAVYDKEAVALQKAILSTLTRLCRHKALVVHEAIIVSSTNTTLLKKSSKEGRFVSELLSLIKDVHESSPKRTAAVLGPDGKSPATYTKRPYAADYKDNPAGDFLTSLELSKDDVDNESSDVVSRLLLKQHKTEETRYILELALETTLTVAQHGGQLVYILYKRDILGLCESLQSYLTPSVVDLASRITAAVCDGCTPAASEPLLLGDGGNSSHVGLLIGVATYSTNTTTIEKAFDRLVTMVYSCNGDDFARLTAVDGPLPLVVAQLKVKSNNDSGGARLIRACADRVQRSRNASSTSVPTGGVWDVIGRAALKEMLMLTPTVVAAPPALKQEEDGLSALKKGFFPASSSNAKKKIQPSPPPAVLDTTTYSNGVVIEELQQEAIQPSPVVVAPTTPIVQEEEEDDGIEELSDVFDSTITDKELRSTRSAWVSIPLNNKIRWNQTSTDISIWLLLPRSTRARDITVTFTTTTLTVSLGWYGRVLDGTLPHSIQPTESQWCIMNNSDDDELYIILPKTHGQVWWKSLFQGSEEKGYYELLKEAVDADEPVTRYHDMDDEAKDLLDSILERQAYINQGLIDPEGFDDFRVVIGENSLGASVGK